MQSETNSNNKGKQTNSKGKQTSKPSQFSNKIITKDDISLLSKSKHANPKSNSNNHKSNKDGHKNSDSDSNEKDSQDNVVIQTKSVIVDSIPPTETNFSDAETVSSSQTQDSDVLFSPLYDSFQSDEYYEQEMYDMDDSLRKFKNYQMSSTPSTLGSGIESYSDDDDNKNNSNKSNFNYQNNNNNNNHILPFDLNDEIKDDDFWKEVKATNDDIIMSNIYNNEDIKSRRRLSIVSQHMANTSMEEFVADDLLITNSSLNNNNNNNNNNYNNNNNNSAMQDDSQYKIKLLCYRDADGKLALKTTNQNKTKLATVNSINSNGPTGLVRRKRVNKKKKILKKAIRRKSGVLEMISTGVKMNEFML